MSPKETRTGASLSRISGQGWMWRRWMFVPVLVMEPRILNLWDDFGLGLGPEARNWERRSRSRKQGEKIAGWPGELWECWI